jgi:peptidoglycan/LPS O-acetylase OafA/YrhL
MNVIAFVVALLFTLAGSALFYRFVEIPAQRVGRTLAAHIRAKLFLIRTQPAPAPVVNNVGLTKTEKPGM